MIGRRIPFETARKMTSQNKGRLWGQGSQSGLVRMNKDFPDFFLQPKFNIPRQASFFTIGSCFAREIELALDVSKIECLSSKALFPPDFFELAKERANNGALNAYTPHSIRDLLKLPTRSDAMTAALLHTGSDECFDMLLSGLKPLNETNTQQARSLLLKAYAGLPAADVVIMTLGYTESWYDARSEMYINRSPGGHIKTARAAAADQRYEFHNISSREATDVLSESVELIRAMNKNAKIIMTTSPVPLHGTFTGSDVIMANQYSKSTLQSASVYVASQFDFVDYFPSYEYVTLLPRSAAFMDDGIHVRGSLVSGIMSSFLNAYIDD